MKACFYIDECSLSYAKLVEKHERTKKFSFVFQKTAQYALYQPHTFLRSKPRFHRFSNKTSLHHKQALFANRHYFLLKPILFTMIFRLYFALTPIYTQSPDRLYIYKRCKIHCMYKQYLPHKVLHHTRPLQEPIKVIQNCIRFAF